MKNLQIAIGSDHGGFEYKSEIIDYLTDFSNLYRKLYQY